MPEVFYQFVSTVYCITGVSRAELWSRGRFSKGPAITDSNSIKRDGSLLKVDMTKQFVSTV